PRGPPPAGALRERPPPRRDGGGPRHQADGRAQGPGDLLLALLFKPVGEDQARGPVERVGDGGPQEGQAPPIGRTGPPQGGTSSAWAPAGRSDGGAGYDLGRASPRRVPDLTDYWGGAGYGQAYRPTCSSAGVRHDRCPTHLAGTPEPPGPLPPAEGGSGPRS